MIVKELIEQLQQENLNAEICIKTWSSECKKDIIIDSYNSNGKIIIKEA